MNVRVPFAVFLGASVLVHAAFVHALAVPENTLAAAGPPPALVAQGNSFADMVKGTPLDTPETVEPVDVIKDAQQPAPPSPSQPTTPTVTAQAGLQLRPRELSETPADVLAIAAAPTIAAIEPVPPAQLSATQPGVIEALPDVQVNEVTGNTVRPLDRPVDLGQPPPRQTPSAVPQSAAAPQGNAAQDAQRGTVTASPNAGQATQQGQGQRVDQAVVQAARQAVANYGNVVMNRISRTRRENTRARGMAVVSFRIAPSGQVSSVGIAQSSGDADLDQIAMNHVRRAAPFPAPPSGARTSFSIQFQGR